MTISDFNKVFLKFTQLLWKILSEKNPDPSPDRKCETSSTSWLVVEEAWPAGRSVMPN